MSRLPRCALALVLAALLAVAPALAQDSPQDERLHLRQRLAALFDQQETLSRTLDATRQEMASLDQRLDQGRQRADQLSAEQGRTSARLQAVQAQMGGLAGLHQRQVKGYQARLRALYLYGAEASEHLWSTSQDLADALTRSQALTRLLDHDRSRLAALKKRRAELAALRTDLAYRQNELMEISARLASIQDDLERMKQERAQLIKDLDRQGAELDQSILALKEAESRLARTFALPGSSPPAVAPAVHAPKAAATPNKNGGVLAAKGSLSPPVEGKLLRRTGPGLRGVLMQSRPGAPVRAPWQGTVVYADNLAGYGKVVVLDHGQRVHTVLAHLGSLAVLSGDVIDSGSVVGSLDPSGRLYLEVRRGVKPDNPLNWLRLKP